MKKENIYVFYIFNFWFDVYSHLQINVIYCLKPRANRNFRIILNSLNICPIHPASVLLLA